MNPGRTVRTIHISEHQTRPGDPLLKPADVNLDPSARLAHVQKRQETDWSNTRDTALVEHEARNLGIPPWSGTTHEWRYTALDLVEVGFLAH